MLMTIKCRCRADSLELALHPVRTGRLGVVNTGVKALREPWNKGKIVGQKAPFKLEDIWALRVRFQMEHRVRKLARFNLGIDCKLRGCDLVALKVRDICHGDQVATRAVVLQHKTQRPVQFQITPATRDGLQACIKQAGLKSDDFLLPSRLHDSPHLGTRQYARILGHWVEELGLDRSDYGTHSMRRTKATLIPMFTSTDAGGAQ
jgi:integrase